MQERRARGSQQASEPPTPRRLQLARRRGEVAYSREVNSAVLWIGLIVLLSWLWPHWLAALRAVLARGLNGAFLSPIDPAAVVNQGLEAVLLLGMPFWIAALVLTLLGALAQVGGRFSLYPLRPQMSRLHPGNNLPRLLEQGSGSEWLKLAVKLVGVGVLAAVTIVEHWPRLAGVFGETPEALLGAMGNLLASFGLRSGALLALLALGDFLFQRHRHRRHLRMTREEVRRELIETQGEPRRKAARQGRHRELAAAPAPDAVAAADCLILDGDQLAVALRYDRATMAAPRIVARGHQLQARRLIAIARQHRLPLCYDARLARELAAIGPRTAIPPALYPAVARVLRGLPDEAVLFRDTKAVGGGGAGVG